MSFITPLSLIDFEDIPPLEKEYDGYVENNDDPLKLGRVQVRISLYEDLPQETLPWATPVPNYFLGASSKSGSFSVPEIGSMLIVYFPTRDENIPYFKGAPLNSKTKSTLFDTNYPNRYGLIDSVGNKFYIDKITGETRYEHPSGTTLQISAIGEVNILAMNKLTLESVIGVDIKAPNINLIGNTHNTAGITTSVPVGTNVLYFDKGLLVNEQI